MPLRTPSGRSGLPSPGAPSEEGGARLGRGGDTMTGSPSGRDELPRTDAGPPRGRRRHRVPVPGTSRTGPLELRVAVVSGAAPAPGALARRAGRAAPRAGLVLSGLL